MKPENWIKWDLNSRLGLKMAIFFSEHGAAGYGYFLFLIETMYLTEGHKLKNDIDSMQTYAKLCKCISGDANAYMLSLHKLGLFVSEGNYFWSPRVLEECTKRGRKKEVLSIKRKDAASVRWNREKAEEKKDNDKTMNMQADANGCKPMQTHANDARLDKSRLDKSRVEYSIVPPSPASEVPLIEPSSELDGIEDEYQAGVKQLLNFDVKPILYGSENRLPFKKYKNLFIAPRALAEILKSWDDDGIDRNRFKEGLQIADSWQVEAIKKGREPQNSPIAKWLRMDIKQQILKLQNESARLKRTEGRVEK